ncbi:GNAT family N-acetyltransferase [Zhihengliuella flava]|uniref:GNAT family acetyltransferase n=1 Tax=Zhihengliuella flava TaxID=1285193 RepID=A0A931D931_9MICC|nr:GNAT family N-acetyltransferase [Zhihengliuella flava]MBG6084268.1 putative GNAT family acetyltransferase [Zhihengliuella flava]
MTEHGTTFTVHHDSRARQFQLLDDATGQVVGRAHYLPHGPAADQRVFFHTVVEDAYSGRGLAHVLGRGALEATIADGLKIVPVCPFIKGFIAKHSDEFGEHAVPVKPAHLEAVRGAGATED